MMTQTEQQKILVVDDDTALANVLENLLTDEGYVVKTARSGEEGLALLRGEKFHISLLDIRLEGMDGVDLMARIHRERIDTEVVFMTSYASIETVVEALRLGAYDYLIKPFENLDQVLDVITRTMEKVNLEEENIRLLEELQSKNKELGQINEKIRGQAVRDGLTGLYNYRFFKEALTKEISRSVRHNHKFCVLMMDVDNFKIYNDTHGHLSGDAVLKEISRILRDRARKSDIIARYGGEEFAAILPETGKNYAKKVAQDFRKRIENFRFPKEEGLPSGKITISIGLAEYPADAEDGLSLVKQADTALYGAKYNGRNQILLAGEKPNGGKRT